MSTLQDAPMTKAELTERARQQIHAAIQLSAQTHEEDWREIALIFLQIAREWKLMD